MRQIYAFNFEEKKKFSTFEILYFHTFVRLKVANTKNTLPPHFSVFLYD